MTNPGNLEFWRAFNPAFSFYKQEILTDELKDFSGAYTQFVYDPVCIWFVYDQFVADSV